MIDTSFHNQRIGVVDVATAKVVMGSPADRHVYDFDWSPDSKRFAATAAPGPGDNNWWIAQLYVFDAAAATGQSIYKPKLEIAVPRWSPDGRRIAFIEGLMSDEGVHGGDLHTIASTGGTPTNHMPGRKTSASSIAWQSADSLLFSECTGGGVSLSTLNLQGGAIEPRWHGDEEARNAGGFPNMSMARDGKSVGIVRSNFTTPGEVWAGPIGEWKQVTHGNAAIQAGWGKPESIEATSDGRRIQAWLLAPANPGPGKHPMVVQVHGGPALSTLRVPTPANLQGDLSDWPPQIYDPFSTRLNPDGSGTFVRDPFPGTKFPPAASTPAWCTLRRRFCLP